MLLLWLLVVVVVVVFLLLLARSNRLHPIVIQSKRFRSIITVTCCMGPVCAPVYLQRASSSMLGDDTNSERYALYSSSS